MKDLIKHKEKVGHSHFFTHKMAAIKTLQSVLKTCGGGTKIHQTTKDYFFNVVGVATFDKNFIIDRLADPVFAEHWTSLVKEKNV